MHRPPAFSTLTSALGENLNAAMVNFSFGSPEPRTLPGTATTSPPLRFFETWPRFWTILVLGDLPRKLAIVIRRGVWYFFPAFLSKPLPPIISGFVGPCGLLFYDPLGGAT